MDIRERESGDVQRLNQRIGREKDAEQRDRCRVVVLAIAGDQTRTIQEKLDRSRGFVQRWAYAYRDGGADAIRAGKPPGATPKLTPAQEQAFKQRMLAGPGEADGGVCALRGKDAQLILEQQFAKPYSLPGVYDLLHRLGLSCLKPRPSHRKNDPKAMRQWLEDAPLLSKNKGKNTPASTSRSGSKMKPASVNRAR